MVTPPQTKGKQTSLYGVPHPHSPRPHTAPPAPGAGAGLGGLRPQQRLEAAAAEADAAAGGWAVGQRVRIAGLQQQQHLNGGVSVGSVGGELGTVGECEVTGWSERTLRSQGGK